MIKFGIIGCGNISSHAHINAFSRLKDKAEISCVCDLDKERAQKALELFGAKKAFTDYHDMVDYVDAVLIALPHRLHYPVGMFFAENKKHILMEKPLCISENEALSLIKKTEEMNVTLMSAYPVRFWKEIIKLKELMDDGVCGDVFQMTVYTDHYNPSRDTRGTWMNCKGLGGGQFFSHGCHYIDILLWFLGNPVSGTHIGTNRGTPWMDREGTSHAVIKFENGALGYHTGTWGAIGTSHKFKVEIYGTKGTLSFCTNGKYNNKIVFLKYVTPIEDDPNVTWIPEDEQVKVLWEKDGSGKNTEGEIDHFINCILNNSKPLTNGKSTLQGLRCIWKMYEAEAENKVADLKGLGLNEPFFDEPVCNFDCSSEDALY